jgi:hypothetical protein
MSRRPTKIAVAQGRISADVRENGREVRGLSSRLVGPTGEVQATVTPSASGIVVESLDEQCARWEVALHRARPWRARAREGSISRRLDVRDPRSDVKASF